MLQEKLKKLLERKESIPKHIAIIMDGNGRWAKKRNLPRVFGHNEGINTVRKMCEICGDIDEIKVLTLYAFSTENWKRSANEIKILMHLFRKFLQYEIDEMNSTGIKLNIIGEISELPEYVREKIYYALEATKSNKKFILNLAVNYGAQSEILSAVKNIIKDKLKPDDITNELFEKYLYTNNLPAVDLLIRTSGEMRISNFLLWQIAYSEFFVTETLWPDFSKEEFIDILLEYQNRERRFGGVNEN